MIAGASAEKQGLHLSIKEKVTAARRLKDRWGESLRSEDGFEGAMTSLVARSEAVAGQMAILQMGAHCRVCASRPGGGCCSEYMGGETDELQILLNFVAGVDIRMVAHLDDTCAFLGNDGCQFLFKPMFCLNYLCQGIRHRSDPQSLRHLELLTGRLLQRQYALEQYLLDWLRRQGR